MTRGKETGWVALLATVEWRSERRHAQRPVAILIGGERVEILDETHWVEGPAVAGEPIETVFEVDGANGHRYRIVVREGQTDRVERLDETGLATWEPVR